MFNKSVENNVPINQQEGWRFTSLSICVCGKHDQRYSIVFNVKNIYLFPYISACHLTFTIIFYCHGVMNTFIQWQETISDAYL